MSSIELCAYGMIAALWGFCAGLTYAVLLVVGVL